MTRINRPDTLLTELRDIKRRLHALETAQRTALRTTPVQTTSAARSEESPTPETTAPEPDPEPDADSA